VLITLLLRVVVAAALMAAVAAGLAGIKPQLGSPLRRERLIQ
jgi:hypothetical protein